LKEFVGASVSYSVQKICNRSEARVAAATVVQSTIAQEGKLGAVIGEFIDLPVIELDRADDLGRLEEPQARARKRR
jgi:hypothetical protein